MGCGSSAETTPDKVSHTNTSNGNAKALRKPSNVNGNTENDNDGKGILSNLNIKPKAEALRFNYDDFKALDDYAKQTPEDVTTNVETLAEYLIKPAKNDVEKVWICENISYNTDSFFGGTSSSLDHSGNGTLKSRSGVCEGYSRLVEALCKAVGIECIKITGYAKGYGHRPDDVISFDQNTNHAWNAVKIDGMWRFIECTWGAGYLHKNFVKQFSNFYFLSPAEDFICDHFPYMNNNLEESNKWQLLKTPITIETYSQLLKPSKEARLYGIKFTSHPFTTIQVVKSTTIKIDAPRNNFQHLFFDMYDSDGNVCNGAVIVLLKTNTEAIITVRPPKVMKYKLELHTKLCDALTHLTDYIINCTAVDDDYEPYPIHRDYYGPSSDFEERGFALTGIDPAMHSMNGEFKLQLTTTAQPQVLVDLEDFEGTDHKKYTMIEQNINSIEIQARLVKKGYYKLTVFSKEYEKDVPFTVAYYFLIKNVNETERKLRFPVTGSITERLHCKLFQPLVRDIPANSDVVFEFIAPSIEEILLNNKFYTEKTGDRWKVTTTTGDSGDLHVSGKISGESCYTGIYVFTIKS